MKSNLAIDTDDQNRYARALARLRLPPFARANALPPFIIALEGANGAGKTTLCRKLARSLGGFACFGTPAAWFSASLKTRMIRDADWYASAMFFFSGCCEQMRELRARKEQLAIMDRSLWSTLAVHAASDVKRLEALLTMLQPVAGQIQAPDMTLVLEASFETCQARIERKSGVDQALDKLTAKADFHRRERVFYRWLGEQASAFEFIDVGSAAAGQVAQQAAALVSRKAKWLTRS